MIFIDKTNEIYELLTIRIHVSSKTPHYITIAKITDKKLSYEYLWAILENSISIAKPENINEELRLSYKLEVPIVITNITWKKLEIEDENNRQSLVFKAQNENSGKKNRKPLKSENIQDTMDIDLIETEKKGKIMIVRIKIKIIATKTKETSLKE